MSHEITQDNEARSIESFNRARVRRALIGTFPCKPLLSIPLGGSVGVTYNYLKARKSTKVTCLKN